MAHAAAELKRRVRGEVLDSAEALAGYASDYGQVHHRTPAVVVRPHAVEDVMEVVRYAARHAIPLSARGVGHATGGQGLTEGGIVIDLTSLRTIHEIRPEEGWFEADSGALWADVLDAASPLGLSPPVLTGYPHVSLGGTLSAAGWGPSSFRRGAQIDNCLALEVVTGAGELVRCSPEVNADLFSHVLGGLGQFGIITRVRHKLRRHGPAIRTYSLVYADLGAMLEDGDRLIAGGVADHVEGFVTHAGGEGGKAAWRYSFDVSVEAQSPEAISDDDLLAGLRFQRCERIRDSTTIAFVRDIPREDSRPGVTHPWTVTFLPRSAARQYIELCLEHLPIATLGGPGGTLRLWPATRQSTRMPMIRVPDEEGMVMFAIFPALPAQLLPPSLALLARASDLAIQLGAKRYVATWTHFDLDRWRTHFGEYWPRINEIRHRYDPSGIFNPHFIQYEPRPAGEAPADTASQRGGG